MNPPKIHSKNLIVKMPNWLGDAVMATPILQDFKHSFPDSKLTVLCQHNVASLLENDPHISEIIRYKKQSGWIHRAEHSDVIEALQKGKYDAGVLLTNSFSSAWWFWRGQVQNRVGFSKFFRNWMLDFPQNFPKNLEELHLVNVYKRLLTPFGIDQSNTKPKLYLNQDDVAFQKRFFELNRIEKDDILIGINPGASYGSAKCWPKERFKEVSRKLLENPQVKIIYFGDSNGASLVHEICNDLPSCVINLSGKTNLRELLALIASCSIFLTNDSGPMHIAAAFEIPLLALFGSTNAIKTGPFNGGNIIDKKVECSPCYKRTCPIDFRCMKEIFSQEVYQELKRMIEK